MSKSCVFLFGFCIFVLASQYVLGGEHPTLHDASRACESRMRNVAPRIHSAINLILNAISYSPIASREKAVLQDCHEFLGISLRYLEASLPNVPHYSLKSLEDGTSDDIWTWLSTTLTGHTMCVDELESLDPSSLAHVLESVKRLQKDARHLLASFVNLRQHALNHSMHLEKVEPSLPYELRDGLPTWLSEERRRSLLEGVTAASTLVVAKDGSGGYTSIQDAVNAASSGSTIYIKKGTYNENVEVPSSKTNLVMYGDGIDKTIITASRHYAEMGTTFKTATLAIKADGFIGKFLTIQNTAGAQKNQAVALLVTSDKAAFYKSSFVANQDTHYTYANRQFYRECQVQGTVDFIFGNSAVVFQQSTLYAKKPLSGQKNMVTAQGRDDPNQNTGISIHQCQVDGAISETYLGRPWKDYSRTVFMQSQLGASINPAGWLAWDGAPASRAKTVYYGEYLNTGPGSGLAKRVTWSKSISKPEASQFTVASFVSGNQWLPSTGIAYTGSLA